MKFLLDTDVIIDHFRNKRSLQAKWLKKGAAISIITHAELLTGAYKSQKATQNLKLINSFLSEADITIINLNQQITEIYAITRARLESVGRKIDHFDLLIAATALSKNLELVTRNRRHFRRVDRLKLANFS